MKSRWMGLALIPAFPDTTDDAACSVACLSACGSRLSVGEAGEHSETGGPVSTILAGGIRDGTPELVPVGIVCRENFHCTELYGTSAISKPSR